MIMPARRASSPRQKGVHLPEGIRYDRRSQERRVRVRRTVLQQEAYAFGPGLYESGRIQADILCLKTKEKVPICACEDPVSKSRRSPLLKWQLKGLSGKVLVDLH